MYPCPRFLGLSLALLLVAACSDSGGTGTDDNPLPVATRLSPSFAEVGSDGLTLSVEGSGFTEESTALWGGASRSTSFVSAGRLQFELTAADLDSSGTVPVTVRTPAPGGGTSAALSFTIQPRPVATIELDPVASTLVPGQEAIVTAVLRSSDGEVLADRTPTWSSSDSAVATVVAGVLSGVGPGSATITAAIESATAEVQVEVVAGGMALPEGAVITAGAVTLTVPAGAVPAALALTVTPNPSPPGTAAVVAGTAFDLGPDGATFGQPVTVEITYDPADRPSGASAADLIVQRWNGSAWESLSAPAVDSLEHRVWGTTTGFSTFAIVHAPSVPEWRQVEGHPGEGWSEQWGDWTVAAGRLWVVENEARSDELPRVHWTDDGVLWNSLDPTTLGYPDLEIAQDSWRGNNLMATGTDAEVVIATLFQDPSESVPGGHLSRREIWVLRGTPGDWTLQGPSNAPGLDEDQIPDDGQYRFSTSSMNGPTASWGDQVVLLPRGIWWYPWATTDQSFVSLTSDPSELWQFFAKREYPWGVNGFQWMTGAAGTPWGYFAVGHIGFETVVWYSADGHLWDVIADPVDAFGGSLEESAKVWSGAMMYGPRGLLMARVRDSGVEQTVAWRTEDGQTWHEALIDDEAFGDPQGFMAGDHYVVVTTSTDRSSDVTLRQVWVSRDAENWVHIPEGPGFDKIIGWDGKLWGFREGEVWELDISRIGA